MSKVGKLPVAIPAGVTVNVANGVISVKGPKGELKQNFNENIDIKVQGTEVLLTTKNDEKQTNAYHGLYRSLIANMVKGVTEGFKKTLDMIGIGFKAQMKGDAVELWAGYSHTVVIEPAKGAKISVNDLTKITVEGIDKQAVGQTAALIREVRPPEPYLGKSIRYKGEYVATKEGKRAGK